jgi:nitrite reductase/ring-hydroxylating ferredoxin subunit
MLGRAKGVAEMVGMAGDLAGIENGRGRPNRRVVLVGAGACAVAGTSAACGGAPGPAAGSTTAVAATATAVASSGAVLAAKTDVPIGGGIIVAGVLVVQPAGGVFKAFDASCPHRGVLVGPPRNGTTTCPAHHSVFAIADGSRMSGPATRGLTEIAVSVRGNVVVRA